MKKIKLYSIFIQSWHTLAWVQLMVPLKETSLRLQFHNCSSLLCISDAASDHFQYFYISFNCFIKNIIFCNYLQNIWTSVSHIKLSLLITSPVLWIHIYMCDIHIWLQLNSLWNGSRPGHKFILIYNLTKVVLRHVIVPAGYHSGGVVFRF